MTPQEIKRRVSLMRLTQRKLARRFNVSQSAIFLLLNQKLTSDRLEKRLARLLGVTVEELRDGGPQPQ
jgi:transcriptional regulator with XRE-family HTH domain